MSKELMTPAEFAEFVRSFGQAVVATADRDGRPEAALVEVAANDDGELVFDTKTEARKVANLFRNARVAIVVGWGGRVSVQVEGEAELLLGAQREKYARFYASQFPQRPPVNDQFALYRVRPAWLRVCESAPVGPPAVVEGAWA